MEYTNKQYLLDKRPTGMPTDDCWKLHEEKITSLKKNEILIEVNLNYGKYFSRVWTCDLTKKYIEINADYRS